jgi:1-phosphofructokinase family hexose kinase
MIVAVTPNASLDRTLALPRFVHDGVLRTTQVITAAGGKGVNVGYAARTIGGQAVLAGFLGGYSGKHLAQLAEADGMRTRWTWIDGETRMTTILAEAETGDMTVVNERGPQINDEDWARFTLDILDAADDATTVCFCGSLPPGATSMGFADLLAALRHRGKGVWVDSSGEGLKTATACEGINIKVNDVEIGGLLGETIRSVDEACDAARRVAGGGNIAAVVTLGARGAVYADVTGCWHAQPPPIQAVSAVGSGDSFFAGLLVGLEAGVGAAEALRQGVASGAANALSLGGGRFSYEQYTQMLAGATVRAV